MNTMRLLTWELRPENPAPYTHDYMSQAQQFERDGTKKLFRVPGLISSYHDFEKDAESKPASGSASCLDFLPDQPFRVGNTASSAPATSSIGPSASEVPQTSVPQRE